MSYQLTAKGESRAMHVKQTRDPEGATLSFMYGVKDEGPVDFEEIADELKTDDESCRRLLEGMLSRGLIKEA